MVLNLSLRVGLQYDGLISLGSFSVKYTVGLAGGLRIEGPGKAGDQKFSDCFFLLTFFTGKIAFGKFSSKDQ